MDAAFAEPMVGSPEVVRGSDFLHFAGVEAPELRVYPLESHVAEKLHAYTLQRKRPSSRVKDLPDIALLARIRAIEAPTLRDPTEGTFRHRALHPVPSELPAPPETWRTPYSRMARRDELPWNDLDEVLAAARAFLEPPLGGATGCWSPKTWSWKRSAD